MKKLSVVLMLVFTVFASFGQKQTYAKITEESLGYKILSVPTNDPEIKFKVDKFSVLDGDTLDLIIERDVDPSIKARILLIDAPELDKKVKYSKEAKDRINELLSSADEIHVEYEGKEKDRYRRDLVHVWVDGILLSEILVTEGFAVARYIEGYIPDSKYAQIIYDSQDYAVRNSLNVWNDGDAQFLSKAEFRNNNQQYGVISNQVSNTNSSNSYSSSNANYTSNNNNNNNNNNVVTEVVTEAVTEYVEQTEAIQQNVYYPNCSAARAAGAAPVYEGQPGYGTHLDRDRDGIGCE